MWFNVTFSDISSIKWRDSCPVSKFWPAAGHPRHGQLGVFSVPNLPRHGHRDVRMSFTSLPSEGPHAVRVSGESNPDLPIQSPARYLCATAAGNNLSNYMIGLADHCTCTYNHYQLKYIHSCIAFFGWYFLYLMGNAFIINWIIKNLHII